MHSQVIDRCLGSHGIAPMHRCLPARQTHSHRLTTRQARGAAVVRCSIATEGVLTIPHQWARIARDHGERVALIEPHRKPPITLTFQEVASQVLEFAAGLQAIGLKPGDRVSLFSENSSRWLIADQAIQMTGAVDAVRGSTAPVDELMYILRHSGSSALVMQDDKALARLLPELTKMDAPRLRFVLVLWGDAAHGGGPTQAKRDALGPSMPLYTFTDVAARGREAAAAGRYVAHPLAHDDLATLVYTSGTTGSPKGVMLSHGNLQYQVDHLGFFMDVRAGERSLSLLPPWHIYERVVSYYILSRAAMQVYSSITKFRDDLATQAPDYMICVPLVLETLKGRVLQKLRALPSARRAVAESLLAASTAFVTWRRVVQGVALQHAQREGARSPVALVRAAVMAALLWPLHKLATILVYKQVRQALGIRRAIICGGGSLPPPLDDFYEAIGLDVFNGWGLTETSPVLACRRTEENVRGSVGLPIPGTELRAVDPVTLEDVADGTQGVLLARGPGVMQGYYGNEAATQQAFRAGDGWLDTGDIGWVAPAGVAGSRMAGNLVLTGRAKDTIVLSNGNNVEPQAIEDAVQRSPLIKFCILVGQDKRALGALLFPDEDAVAQLSATDDLEAMLAADVKKFNRERFGFQEWESIAAIGVASSALSAENGTLTKTMKPRRKEIVEVHKREVDAILHKLR